MWSKVSQQKPQLQIPKGHQDVIAKVSTNKKHHSQQPKPHHGLVTMVCNNKSSVTNTKTSSQSHPNGQHKQFTFVAITKTSSSAKIKTLLQHHCNGQLVCNNKYICHNNKNFIMVLSTITEPNLQSNKHLQKRWKAMTNKSNKPSTTIVRY